MSYEEVLRKVESGELANDPTYGKAADDPEFINAIYKRDTEI